MTREEIVLKLLETKDPPVFKTFADAAKVKFTGCGLRKTGLDDEDDFHVFWMKTGKLHRLDGPAIMHVHGPCRFYINDTNFEVEENYWNHSFVIEYKLENILRQS